MKASVIIQARMGSSRLPGKVMRKIVGIPMIGLIIKRLKKTKNCEKIIVATSKNPENQILIDYLKKNRIPISLGSENDVLSRYYKAATEHKCKNNCENNSRLSFSRSKNFRLFCKKNSVKIILIIYQILNPGHIQMDLMLKFLIINY